MQQAVSLLRHRSKENRDRGDEVTGMIVTMGKDVKKEEVRKEI
jgi:hypothetical protein